MSDICVRQMNVVAVLGNDFIILKRKGDDINAEINVGNAVNVSFVENVQHQLANEPRGHRCPSNCKAISQEFKTDVQIEVDFNQQITFNDQQELHNQFDGLDIDRNWNTAMVNAINESTKRKRCSELDSGYGGYNIDSNAHPNTSNYHNYGHRRTASPTPTSLRSWEKAEVRQQEREDYYDSIWRDNSR